MENIIIQSLIVPESLVSGRREDSGLNPVESWEWLFRRMSCVSSGGEGESRLLIPQTPLS